jgi:hypothetical protein
MARPDLADAGRPADSKTAGDAGQAPASPPHRRPPPMRVVTKGWWTLEEKPADIEELETEARNG